MHKLIFVQNIIENFIKGAIKMTSKNGNELPIAFALELATDLDAMDAFAQMSENDQQCCIDESRRMSTKQEMRDYVSSLKNQSCNRHKGINLQ